ncbi:MAG: transcriptional repressor [Muribaculaceae bacterium]|nr:transcriptional repressor [Muribaculaceae bacterium]
MNTPTDSIHPTATGGGKKDAINAEVLLTESGIRPTANRILVLRELAKAIRPVSLADLEAALDYSMDKASVFRVLELFSQKVLVHVIEDGSRSLKYELCHHGADHKIGDGHVHFHCENCKETFCFEDVSVPSVDIPEGFTPHSLNYMIKGLCPRCSK